MVKQKNAAIKLGQAEWIKAGLAVLRESGVEAVRVEPIAKQLAVTKGSFYWHFKDRNDFLAALFAAWVEMETERIIVLVDAMVGDAATKLLYLFELAVENKDDSRLESAIRAWARQDNSIVEPLQQIDRKRLDYTCGLFLQLGFTPQDAMIRAKLAYHSLVGEYTIGQHGTLAERLVEVRLEYALLIRPNDRN